MYQILEKEDKGLLGYLLCRLVTLSLVNVVATCLKLGQSGRNAKKMFRKLMPVVQIFMSHRHIPKKRIESTIVWRIALTVFDIRLAFKYFSAIPESG